MARFSPQRWNEIDAAFQAALEKSSGERDAYLDGLLEKDPELHREVEKLLAADSRSTDFFEARIPEEIETLAEDLPGSLAGRRVGAYELKEEIGAGGMGSVYLARRADDEYRQQVTVKVIKPGMDSREFLRRFLNERQILAGLEHPNVARMLDGGTTDRGLPYFVMEYIEGEPIDRYCDHHGLPVERRLELFRKVCSAVQAAHRVPVVHRDIKPANILVTEDGEPKLLDFGVAKLLDPERAGATFNPTLVDQMRLMTPAYASPEQLRGDPVTTASDIYSLGMLLYELLTGRKPYDLSNLSRQELERVVCEEEPARPSTVVVRSVERRSGGEETPAQVLSALRGVTPEALRRKLSGDLDNVVLMALRKDPQRRYLTAEQMAEDVRRHLEDRPVVARPRTLRYRTGKFVRRNKLLVAFIVSLMALAVGMTWQSIRVARERDRAELSLARAERASEFLENLFRLSDRSQARGEAVTARELLDKGAEEIEQTLVEEPDLQAHLMKTMGVAYLGLGLYEPGVRLVDKSLASRRKLADELAIADSLSAKVQSLIFTGDYVGAEQPAREALDIRREHLGDEHVDLAKSLHMLGLLYSGQGNFEAAVDHFQPALAMRRRLLGDAHLATLDTISKLGMAHHSLYEYERAEPLFREALDLTRQLEGEIHPAVGDAMNNLALVLSYQGKREESSRWHQEEIEMKRQIYGNDHTKVALALSSLAVLQQAEGELEEAEASYRQALDIYRSKGVETGNLAMTIGNLAAVLRARGDYEAAEAHYRESLEMSRRVSGEGHWTVANTLRNLSAALYSQGKLLEAERCARESVALNRAGALGPDHPYFAHSLIGLAVVLLANDGLDEAEALTEEALIILRAKMQPGHWRIAYAEGTLGDCHRRRGRFEEAEPLLLTSYEILNERLPRSPAVRTSIQRLVDLYEAWGKLDQLAEYRSLLAGTEATS